MASTAEDLPSEIWFYIFTFIEGHDIVQSFSTLNSFFDSLLHSQYLQLHIRIKKNESNKRLPVLTWSHIDLGNIYSLSVGQRKANCLIQFLRWNASYLICLRSLSVYLRKSKFDNHIQIITSALQQMPSLKNIRIKYTAQFNPDIDHFEPLMTYIFSTKSTIQKCSFNFRMFHYNMIVSKWSISPTLKYLNFCNTSWNNLFSILSLTPYLYSFQALIKQSDTILNKDIVLTHLKKVNLYLVCPHLIQLEMLKDVAPNLESLQVQGNFSSKHPAYFNENLWYKVLNNLKYFYVNLSTYSESNSEKQVLRDYILDLNGKVWFTWEEHIPNLYAFIKFTSVTI
ncbi:unnamed protein product [Adineta steineri]|uniref:F-box domain-containing protein n=1 Tax=Adineta steineri TaxID=433720 RepID=A0A814CM48_9BILA|nr:unnamed protein product [Adineta steineri]